MDYFILPTSVIRHSNSPRPPTAEELIGLTDESIWSWFIHCLGWHEPAIPNAVRRQIRKQFEAIPFQHRHHFIRSDLLPHQHLLPESFKLNEPMILAAYQLTLAFRGILALNIHKPIQGSLVEPYAPEHRMWWPEAELDWLQMRRGMLEDVEGKLVDYPTAIQFRIYPPQAIDEAGQCSRAPFGQSIPMVLGEVPGSGYWPIRFSPGSRCAHLGPTSITFKQNQTALGIISPQSLKKIGFSWIENLSPGPQNRVLFKKSCPDDQVGILLWPSLPEIPTPTPRIPVYNGNIIELIDGDRLLIFAGPRRGLQDALFQITIKAIWAGSQDCEGEYANKKYVYPNPCERYPYCVRRPIYAPVMTLDPQVVKNQDRVLPKSEYTPRQKRTGSGCDANGRFEELGSVSSRATTPGRSSAPPLASSPQVSNKRPTAHHEELDSTIRSTKRPRTSPPPSPQVSKKRSATHHEEMVVTIRSTKRPRSSPQISNKRPSTHQDDVSTIPSSKRTRTSPPSSETLLSIPRPRRPRNPASSAPIRAS